MGDRTTSAPRVAVITVQTKACRSVGAATVDQLVAGRLLQVLGPDEVALALAAADEVTERRKRSTRASELALERAQYDADRAERALLACEPENRLVARSLESRWEAKLAGVADAKLSWLSREQPCQHSHLELSWRHWPLICPPYGQLRQHRPRIASD